MSEKPTLTVIDGGKADQNADLKAWVAEFASRLKADAPIVLIGCDRETGHFMMKVRTEGVEELLSTLAMAAGSVVLHAMPKACASAQVEE